jgi:flagellar protein FlaG
MSNDISSAIPSHMAKPLEPAAKAAAPPPEKIVVNAPKKPEIDYDPAELRRNLQEAIQRLNEHMKQSRQHLNFSMDESINRFVITVKNSQSGEVIRQIPDEAVLKIAHNIEDLKGMLHNEKI